MYYGLWCDARRHTLSFIVVDLYYTHSCIVFPVSLSLNYAQPVDCRRWSFNKNVPMWCSMFCRRCRIDKFSFFINLYRTFLLYKYVYFFTVSHLLIYFTLQMLLTPQNRSSFYKTCTQHLCNETSTRQRVSFASNQI